MVQKMKTFAKLIPIIVLLGLLAGCNWLNPAGGTLVLRVPDSAYPPCEVTVVASGVIGGQFTFTIEGQTYTQTGNSLTVTINHLPCEVTVVWFDGSDSQTATETIWLRNVGPVIGNPVLNFITNLWTIHPRARYIVTFPHAYDPEGGPITLVDARVQYVGYEDNTVFCPPFTGVNPPTIDEYHVRLDTGQMLQNAFLFFSMWFGPIDTGTIASGATNLPYSPPDQGVSGYPGGGTCGLNWPTGSRSGTNTIITATFEDEIGAKTTDSWAIPTNPYPGCGVQTPSAVCL